MYGEDMTVDAEATYGQVPKTCGMVCQTITQRLDIFFLQGAGHEVEPLEWGWERSKDIFDERERYVERPYAQALQPGTRRDTSR